MLEERVISMKKQVDDRLRVVIPPAVATVMRRGLYPNRSPSRKFEFQGNGGLFTLISPRYPIIYNCTEVAIGCAFISNFHELVANHSHNEVTWILHKFHCAVAALTPPDILDRIKVLTLP